MVRSVEEILEGTRRARTHLAGEYEIDRLLWELNSLKIESSVFADLVPIRLVTLIEISLRGNIAEAVDHGEPYQTAARSLITRLPGKTITEALFSIAQDKLTIGTIV